MSEEKKQPKTYGSGSGGSVLYAVEARTTNGEPATIAGNALTGEWRHVFFATGPIGVPNLWHHAVSDKYLPGLHTFEAAIALAHWFLAMPKERDGIFPMHPLCVEARLVKVKLTYSHSTEEVGIGEPISLFDLERAAKFTERKP